MPKQTDEEFEAYLKTRIEFLENEENEHENNGTLTDEMRKDYVQRIAFCHDALIGIYLG